MPEVPARADAALPPRRPGPARRLAGARRRSSSSRCCLARPLAAEPAPAAAQHHRQRRRHGRPRVVPGVPAGPPAARTGGSRAGRRTGSRGSRPASSTSRSRRCSSSCSTSVLPYNVAFKLVTALGPVAAAGSAYALGRGLKVRRPGPELFAVAATLFLFFKGVAATRGHARRDDPVQPADHGRADRQRAGGGVLVHARARVRDRVPRRARVLAAHAAAGSGCPRCCSPRPVLCHIVVGDLRRRRRADRLALPPAACARFTSRRARSAPSARCSPRSGPSRCSRRSATRRTCGTRSSPGTSTTSSRAELWWVYALAAIGAVIGAGPPRPRGAHASSPSPLAFAVVFRVWPELHAWNLRFLPFWYLGLYLLAAVGVAEIVRGVAQQVGVVWLGPPPDRGEDWAIGPGRATAAASGWSRTCVAIVLVVPARRRRRSSAAYSRPRLPRLLGRVELLRLRGHVGVEHEAEAVRRVPRPDGPRWAVCPPAARCGRAARRSTPTGRRSR